MARFIALLALIVTPLAHAGDSAQPCGDDIIAAVARHANVTGKVVSQDREQDGLLVAAACKTMPDEPDTTIAAMVFDTENRNHVSTNADEGNKNLQVIALVKAGKVIAANHSIVEEDAATAVDSNSYHIDTAPYWLAPGVRAFGVVFFSTTEDGADCLDTYANNELTLYLREGDRLRPVFGTNLFGFVTIKGNSCNFDNDSKLDSANMTVAMGKLNHGFADLILTAHVVRTECKKNGEDDCPDTSQRIVHKVFKYNGKTYGIDMFRTFWYPVSCSVCNAM